MILTILTNSALFWLAWIAALYFAVHEDRLAANLSIWIPTLIQFCLSFQLKFWARWVDLYLAFATLFIALFFETILITSGIIKYSTLPEGSIIPPLWILGLWVFFSTTMNRTLLIINRSYFFAPAVGAIAPFSYLAGEKAGACQFLVSTPLAFFTLFIVWTLAIGLLIFLNRKLSKKLLPKGSYDYKKFR